MRVFKTILLFGLLALMVPAPPEAELQEAGITVSTPALLSAATQTVADLGQFCGRQPGVCETAGFVAAKLEAKAKYSVRLIYDWANEAEAAPGKLPVRDLQVEAVDPIETGSTRRIVAALAEDIDSGTLTLDDCVPEWRGPGAERRS